MCATPMNSASERISQLRFEALLAQYQRDGWPLDVVLAIAKQPMLPVSQVVLAYVR